MDRSTRFSIALFAGISLISGIVPVFASASPFTDVSSSTSYRTAIEALSSQGAVEGYADGSFKPKESINRAEFLKILLKLLGSDGPTMTAGNCFSDVQNEWFSGYVCTAKKEGYVSGYPDGLFHPERDINFVEASKILSLAYEQKAQSSGGDWYQPYVEALESAKVIPPSINAVDKRITRGEMAEMMWRIKEGKTDQPTKGLLNVKYPDAQVNFASDSIQLAKSCIDLRAVSEQARTSVSQGYSGRGMMLEDAMMGVAAPMMRANGAQDMAKATSTGDYSKTNVQVEGVDEADTVKTDGTYVYMLAGNTLKIVKATPADNMRVVSTLAFLDNVQPTALFVEGGQLVVLANSYDQRMGEPVPMPMDGLMRKSMIWPPMRSRQSTKVLLYTLKDGTALLERTLSFEGSEVSSRLIGDKMYLVTRSGFRFGVMPLGAKETDLLPTMTDSKSGNIEKPVARCGDVSILPHVPSPEFLTVSVISLADAKQAEVKTETILGSAQNVYSSQKNLFVAVTEWRYLWKTGAAEEPSEKTNFYRFAFTDDGVKLAAEGSVPGHLLNQFSMDESGDTFRLATTVSPVWSSDEGKSTKSSSALYVLNTDLVTVGSISDIAPGESIYSVRFMGNRAYMVTFKQVDPLFVIDLSDPRSPKILGKLKIPGYSNYLHPYDETHLLGFGKEVDESIDADKVHSDDAVYFTAILGMKVAMFDVSDVENPKELWKEVIGDRGTESPLLSDHKALLFDNERGLLAFPVLVTKRPDGTSAGADGSPVFQGAYVYDVSIAGGFKKLGTITHYGDTDSFMKAGDYWYRGSSDISRILRIENSLITVSQDLLRSTGWPSIAAEGSVKL